MARSYVVSSKAKIVCGLRVMKSTPHKMREIHKSGSERGVKLFYKAEYCGTPQSKEGRNREYRGPGNGYLLRGNRKQR